MVRTSRPPVNEVRERVGLPPHHGDLAEMFSSIPLLLYMTAEPFEYPRSDWPENVRLVGPCDWDPPAELPAGLEEVAEPIVPHAPILDRAACAVTHGGMGTTQKALARGVPVCVVPFGRDQLEVARRVEVAGAGTRLPARRLTPKRLRAAVREAMRRDAGARRGGVARRRRCPVTTPGAHRATRACTTRPTRRRWRRSWPSCATPAMTVTAGGCER